MCKSIAGFLAIPLACLLLVSTPRAARSGQIVYSTNFDLSRPSFTESVVLPQFDPALGSLGSVELTITGSVFGDLFLSNSGPQDLSTVVRLDGGAGASGPGGLQAGAGTDSTVDFVGIFTVPAGASLYEIGNVAVPMLDKNNPPLNILTTGFDDYVGTGSVNFNMVGGFSFSFTNPTGNLGTALQLSRTVFGTLTIDYGLAVPEPSSLVLAALGFAGLVWRWRKRR